MSARSRQLILNTLTVTLTAVILSWIVLTTAGVAATVTPSVSTASGGGSSVVSSAPDCPSGTDYKGSSRAPLNVGYVLDPWHIGKFSKLMRPYKTAFFGWFENWGSSANPETTNNANPWKWFAEAEAKKITPYITWEPWAGPSTYVDGVEPNGWSNADIAGGVHDAYIKLWAREIKRYKKPVYIRFAHEMSGNWYPWSVDPKDYVAMWRHVVTLVRKQGATNARFVWAPNASSYMTNEQWCESFMPYWPGKSYVSDVGLTAIDFGANYKSDLTMPIVAERIAVIRHFGKPIDLSEFNSAWGVRASFYSGLQTYLKRAYWVKNVIFSQAPSQTKDTAGAAGNMDWSLLTDPTTRRIVKAIMKERQGHKGG